MTTWRKSRNSGSEANCVEVADSGGNAVLVRDTKNRAGTVLRVPGSSWRKFTNGIKQDIKQDRTTPS